MRQSVDPSFVIDRFIDIDRVFGIGLFYNAYTLTIVTSENHMIQK